MSKKQILVLGGNGQMGTETQARVASNPDLEYIFLDRDGLDITKVNEVRQSFEKIRPDIILNYAAYTNVEEAETDPINFLINQQAVQHIAQAAQEIQAPVIHLSTDFVFDGHQNTPYLETDPANPLNKYGEAKLLGEQELQKYQPQSVILRTSWLYSNQNNNFATKIASLAQQREELNVVIDQVGTPTSALWLAELIVNTIIPQIVNGDISCFGLYHCSNNGVASWYDFAWEIVHQLQIPCTILATDSTAFVQKATRPAYSVLDKSKLESTFAIKVPHWKESLELCLQQNP